MSWSSALILKDGEQVVHDWAGTHYKPYKMTEQDFQAITLGGHRGRKYRTKEKTDPNKGVLVLTNQRLIWLEKRGIIGKSFHSLFEIHLPNLLGISLQGRITKRVSITDDVREYLFSLKGIGKKEIEPFKDMIMRQAEKIREEKSVTKEVITRETVMIPCQFCRGLMPQTSAFCPNCGAQRKA